MTVQRFRRKPRQEDREDQFAARYEPGANLIDLMTVAGMADSRAELAEVTFSSGRVLVVRYERFHDDHPSETEYETVESGHYLAFSSGGYSLYESDDADWRQFYDLVPDSEV